MESVGSSLAASVGRSAQKLGLAFALAVAALAPAQGRSLSSDEAVVAVTALPAEAQRTELLIRSGGPFPHAKDGSVFGNRERQLPRQNRGYYREYTVETPGVRHRGARRIVCGGQEAAKPKACYYTADHYATFKRIVGSAGSVTTVQQVRQ